MTKNIYVYLFAITLLIAANSYGAVRVSVSQISSDAHDSCGDGWIWNWNDVGNALRAQLVTELSKHKDLAIQERQNINRMYEEEHLLVNQSEAHAPKKNKFKAAQYSITGTVTAFEYCNKNTGVDFDIGSAVGLGGLGLGASVNRGNAKVAMDMRVINVQTGEVVESFTVDGEASRGGVAGNIDYNGIKVGGRDFNRTPLGEANREAIKKASDKSYSVIVAGKKL